MMSNKIHFVRRYTKRETSKRDFKIVKTWATPKESDSEPHSGPSGLERVRLPGSDPDSSDSSDLTYHPSEGTELPGLSGQSTVPPSTSETPAVTETDELKSTSEVEGVEPPYSSENAEYLPPSTPHSSESSSSPASTVSSETRKSSTGKTKDSTSKSESAPETKWTVKNWKDVDILSDDNMPLSPALPSEIILEPPISLSSGVRRDERVDSLLETLPREESPQPPELMHEPLPSSEGQRNDQSVKTSEQHLHHEESPAPPDLVHELPSLPEDSSLASPSPEGEADEPPQLEMAEMADTSDANNASGVSLSSTRTLSVRLTRIQVDQYQMKESSGRTDASESPDLENDDKSYSESEDKITSSQDTSRKPFKLKGQGPKSVQKKRKAGQKTDISDCDSSTLESFAEVSIKDPQQVVSSSGKDPSVSPPEHFERAVDENIEQGKEVDASLQESEMSDSEMPKGKKSSTSGSAGQKSKGRATPKNKAKSSTQKSGRTPSRPTSLSPELVTPSYVEDSTKRRKKQSDSVKESSTKVKKSRKSRVSKTANSQKGEMEETFTEQASRNEFSENESTTAPTKVLSDKKRAEMLTRPSEVASRSRTSSSSTHEDESAQAKRAKLMSGKKGRSLTEDAADDSVDDAASVASSMRMEVVDFEKTPGNDSTLARKLAASAGSLWKGKKITALKPRARSPRFRDQTSSVASDDMSLVSSTPAEMKLSKRAPVKRGTKKQTKKTSPKRAGTKPRGRKDTTAEFETQSRSVSVWSQSNQPRRGTDVLDLDIVLECLQSVEREMFEEAESRPCEKATQKVGSFVRREVHRTICQVQDIKHNQAEAKKLRQTVRSSRAELQEKQVDKIKLNAQLRKLRNKSGIDEDLINLNSWLDDYDQLIKAWDQSKAAQSKPQRYKWIGIIPEEIKALV